MRIPIWAAFVGGAALMIVAGKAWDLAAPCHRSHDLLNPEARCDTHAVDGEWDYEPLRDQLMAAKEALKDTGRISHISVYFRDLDRGPRFGIGEYDKFQPASLLKLPLMIAFLHEADRDPSILDKKLSFSGKLNVERNVVRAEETMLPDRQYAVRELLEKMIVYSDNYSYTVLTHEINDKPPASVGRMFRDLGILTMMTAPDADVVSIQSYGNLFAVLYNTGYLSRQSSQYALDLLSRSTFGTGLVRGVPEDIRVAHKFGHRVPPEGDSQLHDCGIVYHPATAYILCVMTSGTDMASEEDAIAVMSQIVYDGVSSLQPEDQER